MAARKKTTTKKVEDLTSQTTEAFQDNVEKLSQSFADLGDFGKANVEAVIESAQRSAKGVETVSQEASSFGKKVFEDSVEAMKALSTAKNPQQFIETQSEFTRSIVEAQMAQVSKMADLFMGVSKEAVEPIGKRYTAMVDMVQSYRA